MPSQEQKDEYARDINEKNDTEPFSFEWLGKAIAEGNKSENNTHIHIHQWEYQAGGKNTLRYCGCGECYVLHEVKFSHGIEYKWRKIYA